MELDHRDRVVLKAEQPFQDYRQADIHARQLAEGYSGPVVVQFEPCFVSSKQANKCGTFGAIHVEPPNDDRGRMSGPEVSDGFGCFIVLDGYPDWERVSHDSLSRFVEATELRLGATHPDMEGCREWARSKGWQG